MVAHEPNNLQSPKEYRDSTPNSGVNSENSPLGIYTEFSSPCPPLSGQFSSPEIIRARKSVLRKRYVLQSEARKLLPDNRRLDMCSRSVAPTFTAVKVAYNPKISNARFANLCRCESGWLCPVCAMALSERRRHELLNAVYAGKLRGLLPIHIIYTMKHQKGEELKQLLHILIKAFDRTNSGKAGVHMRAKFGFAGYVRTLEVTEGSKSHNNGWHPHLHVLMFCAVAIADDDEDYAESVRAHIWERWSNALESHGGSALEEYGLRVKTGSTYTAEYIAKYGREPREKTWSIEREIAKASSKTAKEDGRTPFSLLEDALLGDIGAALLFQEFAAAIKGRSQMHWSKGLKDLLEVDVLSDKDAISWGADYVQRLLIELDTWKEIERRGLRGDVVAALVEHGGNPYPVIAMIEEQTGKHGAHPVFDDSEVVF
jgi:hypothetical protein